VNKSGEATAKPFARKVVVSSDGRHTRIYGDNGKLIKEGEGNTKEIQDAVKASEKKANLTNEQRQRNERASDLVNQTAKNITRSEVNSLAKAKLATGEPDSEADTPANRRARAKEVELQKITQSNVDRKIKVKLAKDALEAKKTQDFRDRIPKK
jgi:hypothetical protein